MMHNSTASTGPTTMNPTATRDDVDTNMDVFLSFGKKHEPAVVDMWERGWGYLAIFMLCRRWGGKEIDIGRATSKAVKISVPFCVIFRNGTTQQRWKSPMNGMATH